VQLYVYNNWYLLFFLDDCLLSSLGWNLTRTTDRCFPEVKRPGREVDNSLLSSADVKNEWSCASAPLHSFLTSTGTAVLLVRCRLGGMMQTWLNLHVIILI